MTGIVCLLRVELVGGKEESGCTKKLGMVDRPRSTNPFTPILDSSNSLRCFNRSYFGPVSISLVVDMVIFSE